MVACDFTMCWTWWEVPPDWPSGAHWWQVTWVWRWAHFWWVQGACSFAGRTFCELVIPQNSDIILRWVGGQRLVCYVRGLWSEPCLRSLLQQSLPCWVSTLFTCWAFASESVYCFLSTRTFSLGLSLASETDKPQKELEKLEGVLSCTCAFFSKWPLVSCLTSLWALASSHLK